MGTDHELLLEELSEERDRVDALKECLEKQRAKYDALAEASQAEHQEMFHFLEAKDELLDKANR